MRNLLRRYIYKGVYYLSVYLSVCRLDILLLNFFWAVCPCSIIQLLQQGLDSRQKMQKERLQDDFTRALNSFQRIQTEAAQKEKADLAAAR